MAGQATVSCICMGKLPGITIYPLNAYEYTMQKISKSEENHSNLNRLLFLFRLIFCRMEIAIEKRTKQL